MAFTLNPHACEFTQGMTAHVTPQHSVIEEASQYAMLDEFLEYAAEVGHWGIGGTSMPSCSANIELRNKFDAISLPYTLLGQLVVVSPAVNAAAEEAAQYARLDELLEYADEAGHWGVGGSTIPSESANIALQNEFDAVSSETDQHAISSKYLAMLG